MPPHTFDRKLNLIEWANRGLDRASRVSRRRLLGIAILCFSVLSALAMSGESSTFDEGTHLSAGYTYWAAGDFRMNPEHPPFAKLLAALPLLFTDVRWPRDTGSWDLGSEDDFAFQFMYQSGNRPDWMLALGRIPMLLWGILLLFGVHRVSEEHFGPRGALISLTIAATCPTLLAHSHLVATDIAGAALILLTVWRFWRLLGRPGMRDAALCGMLLGLALATKFSCLLLGPILIGVALVDVLQDRAVWRKILRDRLPSIGVVVATAFVLLWGIYGFRYDASPDPDVALPWDRIPVHPTLTRKLVDLARATKTLPEAYLFGLAKVDDHNNWGHSAYLLGMHSTTGWWEYFPVAFLLKTPLSALILFALGVAAWAQAGRRDKIALAYLVLPIVVIAAVTMSGKINIGIRHFYPVFPFLMVLAGGVSLSIPSRPRLGAATTLLLAAGCLDCLLAAPSYLAYFNLPSRLLGERQELLADSNLDWGQDLGRLKRFMDQRGIPTLKLSYFGSASPRKLRLRHEVLPGFNQYANHEPEWPKASSLKSGDWVAVSATNLVGVYLEDKSSFDWLRQLRPVEVIGHSIFVYRIPEYSP